MTTKNVKVYETTFYGATNSKGARIKVTDMKSGESVFMDYNYNLVGLELHKAVVIGAAWKMDKHGIQYDNLMYGGETVKGYLLVELFDY